MRANILGLRVLRVRAVIQKIEKVEQKFELASGRAKEEQLRDEKKQPRAKEEQLRDEKKQLREGKLYAVMCVMLQVVC